MPGAPSSFLFLVRPGAPIVASLFLISRKGKLQNIQPTIQENGKTPYPSIHCHKSPVLLLLLTSHRFQEACRWGSCLTPTQCPTRPAEIGRRSVFGFSLPPRERIKRNTHTHRHESLHTSGSPNQTGKKENKNNGFTPQSPPKKKHHHLDFWTALSCHKEKTRMEPTNPNAHTCSKTSGQTLFDTLMGRSCTKDTLIESYN